MQSVIQLLFDILLFNTVFSTMQIIGIAVVLSGFTVKWCAEIRNAFFNKRLRSTTNSTAILGPKPSAAGDLQLEERPQQAYLSNNPSYSQQ